MVATVAQEFWRGVGARRAMTHDSAPVALAQLVRRNRRRYGGYIVHAGLAVLLVGVAASSSFQHSQDVTLAPGQHVERRRLHDHATCVRPARPRAAKISFGAVLDVTKGGKHVTTLTTTRGFYPAQDPTLGPIGRFFNGSSRTATSACEPGSTKDIWAVINPDLGPLQPLITQGDRLFAALTSAGHARAAQARRSPPAVNWSPVPSATAAIGGLTARFVSHPWPVNFLLIVSPLVTWIWLGALIIALRRADRAVAGAGVARRRRPWRAVAGAPARSSPRRPRARARRSLGRM